MSWMSASRPQTGSLSGHADDLLVRALLVRHVEDADRPDADPAAGERRVADEHERVERVAVLGERALDEAVVGRVAHRREEPAVEDDPAELVVVLVLVARPARDLDEDHDVAHTAATLAAEPRLTRGVVSWERQARCLSDERGSPAAQLASEQDEQRLERELRRELELLEPAPRVAHRLGRPLGPEQPLAGRVGPEQLEQVDVRRRLLGSDADDDEIAVPGGELLELRRAAPRARPRAARAARAARPRASAARARAPSRPRAPSPRPRAPGELSSSAAAASDRLEAGLRVDGAGLGEQRRRAARPHCGSSSARKPVEAARRRPARARAGAAAIELGRPRVERLADRPLREPRERHELAAGADRLRDRPEVVGDEDDHGVRRAAPRGPSAARRRRPRSSGARSGSGTRAGRPRTGACAGRAAARGSRRSGSSRRARRARRGRGARAGSSRAAPARTRARARRLPTPGGPVEEIGVHRPLDERGVEQPLGLVLLAKALELAHVPPPRSRPAAATRRAM